MSSELGLIRAKCDCGEKLWKRRRGEYTLSNRTLVLRQNAYLVALCPACGEDVPVPFLRVEAPEAPAIRFTVRLDSVGKS